MARCVFLGCCSAGMCLLDRVQPSCLCFLAAALLLFFPPPPTPPGAAFTFSYCHFISCICLRLSFIAHICQAVCL